MSASDRQDAARKALEAYDKAGPTCYKSNDTVAGESYNALDALAAMADVLRDLTTPPVTIETPEQIAMRVYMGIHSFPAIVDGDIMRDLIKRGIEAGIQAAWESWEPESVPTAPEVPDAVGRHLAEVCEEAYLGVMVQVLGILRDRELFEDDELLGITDGDVTGWYFQHIAPAIDDIENDLSRMNNKEED